MKHLSCLALNAQPLNQTYLAFSTHGSLESSRELLAGEVTRPY